jgi:hypothetical protein
MRFRQSAILNDDLTTVITEIEALDAQLVPSLDDTSDSLHGRRNLPSLTWSKTSEPGPCVGSQVTIRSLLSGSLTRSTPVMWSDAPILERLPAMNIVLVALNRPNEVQVFGQECQTTSIQYPRFADASSHGEVTARQGGAIGISLPKEIVR